MPAPTSLETRIDGPDRRFESRKQRFDRRIDLALGLHQIGEPERETIDQHNPVGANSRNKGPGQFERFFDRLPAIPPPCPMVGDALGHLVIASLGGGNVNG